MTQIQLPHFCSLFLFHCLFVPFSALFSLLFLSWSFPSLTAYFVLRTSRGTSARQPYIYLNWRFSVLSWHKWYKLLETVVKLVAPSPLTHYPNLCSLVQIHVYSTLPNAVWHVSSKDTDLSQKEQKDQLFIFHSSWLPLFCGLALSHTAFETGFHKRTSVSSGVAYTLTVTVQKNFQPLQIVLERSWKVAVKTI